MTDNSHKRVERLFESENLNPALKASYQQELTDMLEPKLTIRSAMPGIVLLVILLACIVGLVRNLFVREAETLVLFSWIVMLGAFAWAAYLIVRDLIRKKHSPSAVSSISQALFAAGGAITVASLLAGLSEPANPASTFSALFVFVFYFTCAVWALQNRLAASELAAREQMLRIEYRLAELAERLQK